MLKSTTPAARLEFLEFALGPQIKDAERQAAAQAAATRAATIASRADELAAADAELARLAKAHTKIGASLDTATRAFRALQDEAIRSALELQAANYRRDMISGRYERTLAGLGGDHVAVALYRLRWLARVAADRLALPRPPVGPLKIYERAIDRRTLDWDPEALAEVTARTLPTIEALELAPVGIEQIQAACAAAMETCYAAAGETVMRCAPWATTTSSARMN